MRTIYKYPLHIVAEQIIDLPAAYVLTLQVQHNKPTLWCAVLTGTSTYKVRFFCVGTGHDIPNDATYYLGTVQIEGFVWHFFHDSAVLWQRTNAQ